MFIVLHYLSHKMAIIDFFSLSACGVCGNCDTFKPVYFRYLSIFLGECLMKRIFSVIALVLAFSLTACSKEEVTKNYFNIRQKIERKDGRAVILPPPIAPQPPEFPKDAEIQAKIAENLAYINSKIVEKDGKTTYYFVEQKDKDGKNTYSLTDDKSKADYYRVILGTTADGYCAVQDFHANGNKQIEPFIEQDINYCNGYGPGDKPLDSLIEVYYDIKGKINFIVFDVQAKKRFVFVYDENGKKSIVRIFDISEPSNKKITEFYFNEKERIGKYKSSISIIEFNGEEIVKSTVFFYLGTHLKNIDQIEQYDHIAQDKKQIMWFPQKLENVAVYFDNDPKYEKNNKEIFEQRKKWMKYTEEEFNFRLSQNSHNQ
ncbi:MAG: hypothetical protein IJ187_06250 [Neisseriaceae bacterium]|nr:hypothetical protein [Neisseriaceae bacterium]MBQ9725584.1 hypothetical protein [Neisseriaceae bacterium]